MRPKLLLVTTLHHTTRFKFLWQFLFILQHLLMMYIWNHCDQAADMVWNVPFCWDYQMDISFAIYEAVLLKLEADQILFYVVSISFQFCWIWWRKLTIFVPILAHFRPYLACLKPVFCIKFRKIEKSQNYNRKIIELPHISTERLHV